MNGDVCRYYQFSQAVSGNLIQCGGRPLLIITYLVLYSNLGLQ